MGNQRIKTAGLLAALLLLLCGGSNAQTQTVIPQAPAMPSGNGVQYFDGAKWDTRQLLGFTVTGSTISPPTIVDGSIINEGFLTVDTGTVSTSLIKSNTATSVPVTLAAGFGLLISESGNTITYSNPSPDQVVTLAGGGITVPSGTYPNFTITSTEVDGNVNNEGILGVTAATSNSSRLTSNSTLANGVEIIANSPLSISETTSANGGTITLGISLPDNSNTNEGSLSLSGTTSASGAAIISNTAGSINVNFEGKDGTYIHRSNDTIYIGNRNTNNFLTNHGSLTVSTTTLTNVSGTLIEQEDGLNTPFTIYLHYTTGATSQGLQFRLNPSGSGTFWYDYNFPITGDRITGSIYNANTTITIPSSETGTNIAIIRGISKSSAVGAGIFELRLQIAAEDGSSTITTLTTGVTQF